MARDVAQNGGLTQELGCGLASSPDTEDSFAKDNQLPEAIEKTQPSSRAGRKPPAANNNLPLNWDCWRESHEFASQWCKEKDLNELIGHEIAERTADVCATRRKYRERNLSGRRKYARTTAKNQYNKHYRDMQKNVRYEDELYLSRKSLTPQSHLIQREAKKAINDAINGLRRKYRLPFLMKYVRGLHATVIAASLNISEELVNTRISRARKVVETALGGKWDDLLPVKRKKSGKRNKNKHSANG